MNKEIELGDTVKDIYCGFTGVAISKTEFVNGCIQYAIVAPCKKNEHPEELSIDRESLVVIKKGKRIKKQVLTTEDDWKDSKENGGPMRKSPRQGGYKKWQ